MKLIADVYLMDQAPRIGCGWRRCEVIVGRKWLRLTERATGRRAKLPKVTAHRIPEARYDEDDWSEDCCLSAI